MLQCLRSVRRPGEPSNRHSVFATSCCQSKHRPSSSPSSLLASSSSTIGNSHHQYSTSSYRQSKHCPLSSPLVKVLLPMLCIAVWEQLSQTKASLVTWFHHYYHHHRRPKHQHYSTFSYRQSKHCPFSSPFVNALYRVLEKIISNQSHPCHLVSSESFWPDNELGGDESRRNWNLLVY